MLIHERGIISDAEYSDTNKYSKQEQASGTDCLFTSVGLGRTKLPYQMTHMQMTPEAPTQPTEHDGQPGCSVQIQMLSPS